MWWKDSASLKKRSAAAPFSMKWANASFRSCLEFKTAWFFPSPGSRPSISNNFTPDRTTSTQALTLEERRKMLTGKTTCTLGCLWDNTMRSLPSQWCLLVTALMLRGKTTNQMKKKKKSQPKAYEYPKTLYYSILLLSGFYGAPALQRREGFLTFCWIKTRKSKLQGGTSCAAIGLLKKG